MVQFGLTAGGFNHCHYNKITKVCAVQGLLCQPAAVRGERQPNGDEGAQAHLGASSSSSS